MNKKKLILTQGSLLHSYSNLSFLTLQWWIKCLGEKCHMYMLTWETVARPMQCHLDFWHWGTFPSCFNLMVTEFHVVHSSVAASLFTCILKPWGFPVHQIEHILSSTVGRSLLSFICLFTCFLLFSGGTHGNGGVYRRCTDLIVLGSFSSDYKAVSLLMVRATADHVWPFRVSPDEYSSLLLHNSSMHYDDYNQSLIAWWLAT